MAAPNYNITSLLFQAFGITKAIVSPGAMISLKVIEEATQIERLSYLGTPILNTLTLKGQNYRKYDETGKLTTVQLNDFLMPAVTLSTFSRSKKISKTELVAGYGTVKEMYGFGDWDIEIRGLCLWDPIRLGDATAFAQHLLIQQFENVAEAIPVVSKLYNSKGINAIVIENIKWEQLEGKPGVIPFRINCVSDRPTELIL
jgi:hypothetical protein